MYDSTAADNTIIVLRDLNAKVGKEMTLRGTTRLHSLHDIPSGNMCKLIGSAVSKNVVISSVCFHIRKYTREHEYLWMA
jgi:hypothetical protein